jgi:hypothetical protein
LVVVDTQNRRLAVECDGDFHYEADGNLRPEDYQRQDIIERAGWTVYRLPARRFYWNPEAALDALVERLAEQPAEAGLVVDVSPVTTDESGAEGFEEMGQESGDGDVDEGGFAEGGSATQVGGFAAAAAAGEIDQDAGAWTAVAQWGRISGKLSLETTMFCSDIARRLKRGVRLNDVEKDSCRQVWRSACALGFGGEAEREVRSGPLCGSGGGAMAARA